MKKYDIHILDLQSDDIDNIFTITIYGKTIDDENIVCHVKDFKPYFYVKIPDSWDKNAFESNIIKEVEKSFKYWEKNFIKTEIKSPQLYYDFYGYHWDYNNNIPKKFKFIKLEFDSNRSYNRYKKGCIDLFKLSKSKKIEEWRKICNDECLANLYEANIHPILRFIHEREIKPSGWITVSGKSIRTIDDKTFKCDIELECRKTAIKPNTETDGFSNLILASFDIECDSLTGEFPQAIKDFKSLSVDIYDGYSNWFEEIYEYENKVSILKGFINQAFEKDEVIFNDINYIHTENGIPDNIDSLTLFDKDFINKLDDCIINKDKDKRIKIIDEIKEIFDKELKNKGMNIIVKGDPIIQIGTVFYYTHTKEYKRYIQVIKPDDLDEKICDSLEEYDIIVEECKDERELLIKWRNMINIMNPDMITGYNIFGFDFDYIAKRVEKFGYEKKFYNLGRLNMYSDNADNHYMKKCKLLTKRLASSALGDNTLKYFNMDGRVSFDVQKEIQKGHNLDSYKLDDVASYFMRGKINESTTNMNRNRDKIFVFSYTDGINMKLRIWEFYTNSIGHLKIGDYITVNIHSNVGEVLLFNGQKFKIHNIKKNHIQIQIEKLNVKHELSKYKYTKLEWCMNKDDVPPHEIFRLHKEGGSEGRAKVAKYCIQDCELCIHLVNLLDMVPNNIGMSNVCLVPFSYIFLRGQGVKVTSFVSDECNRQKTRMPTLKDYKETNDGYEGAIVLDPVTGIYLEDPIVVLDYASLYPSSIIENNLSQDKYLTDEKYIQKLKDENRFDDEVETIVYDDYRYEKKGATVKKIKTDETITCYFMKNKKDENGEIDKKSMGIIPTVLQNVLDARKNTRLKIKEEPDEFKKKVLDGLQLAYKVTANSVYGQLGAKTSSIYMKKIAACTTSVGRQRIDDADNGVKEWALKEGYDKPEIVYGDTDSVFIKFSRKTLEGETLKGDELLKHCIRCGIKAGEYVDSKLRNPQCLEYEKTFFPFILISKKRYVGDKYEWESDVDKKNFKRTSMGIVMKRRDNAPIVKYVFGNIIEKIMIDRNFVEALQWLNQTLYDIQNKQFPINYFIVSKSLRGFYKNPQSIAHKVLADRIGERDPGNKPKSNDRIPYAYIKLTDYDIVFDRDSQYKSGKNKGRDRKRSILQGNRIEHPDFIHSNKLELDYSFYITNQIMNPVKQVLDLNTEYLEKTEEIFNRYIVTDDMLYEYMLKFK